MCKSIDGLTGTKGKVADWIRWWAQVLMVPLFLLVCASAFAVWQTTEERLDAAEVNIAGITASRFTASDGLEVWKKIADIQTQLESEKTSGGLEGEKLRSDVAEIKAELRTLRELIQRFHMNGGR